MISSEKSEIWRINDIKWTKKMQNERSDTKLEHLNKVFTQNQKFHKIIGLKWTKSSATQSYISVRQP